MVTEQKRRVDLPESSHASKLARSDDINERRSGLEPEHTIFLSHSGKQKNFTEWLWGELKRAHHCPFFDKDWDSCRKGEDFSSAIIQAARQCRVAILVLSEDFFTRSKWPMIELNEFVQAQASTNSRLKLLPLFYKLSVEEFKDAERQKRWQDIWEGWAAEDVRTNRAHKLDVGAWVSALSVVGRSNGLEYVEAVGKATYVRSVVEAVRKLKVPRVKSDVSDVQALKLLCEPIFAKFHGLGDKHLDYKAQVVGLFGMGGVGKTTISKAMCNGDYGDFDGDFCHVEFGSNNYVELRMKVLEDLTGERNFPKDLDKLRTLLHKCMQHQKVFLCLDNVWPGDIDEAKIYLQLNFQAGSKVLVTSRSLEVLERLGLKECQRMGMPELDKWESTQLFLHYVGVVSSNHFTKEEQDEIDACVQACHFSEQSVYGSMIDSSPKQYLPLALKAWGTQLGQISKCPLAWKESLEDLNKYKFNLHGDNVHPLFSILRRGYDLLERTKKLVFLDLAIFVLGSARHWDIDVMEWLRHAYGWEDSFIVESLKALKKKALLDFATTHQGLEFWIHDLYLDFAKAEIQASEFGSCILYDEEGECLPRKLQTKKECQDLVRMGICGSKVKVIKRDDLVHCSQVEVLQIYDCKNLEELDVEGMDGLRILDVVGCEKLVENFRGLNKLKALEWLRLFDVDPKVFLADFSSLTNLQYLHVYCNQGHSCGPINLSGCNNLHKLSFCGEESFFILENSTMVEKIVSVGCSGMESKIASNSLINLKILDLSYSFSLEELHGLGKLQHLQELNVLCCVELTSLVGLEYVTSLVSLEAQFCKSLCELPCMNNLRRLEKVDLSNSGISMIPCGFGRLAKNRILELFDCVEMLEPLVLWLWEQEQLMVEELNHRIHLEYMDIEENEGNLRSNIRKDVVYYMDQMTVKFNDATFYDSLELSQNNSLEQVEGGVDFAVKAFCEYEDMGILSLIVAKYSFRIAPKTSFQELSSRILNFLNHQFDISKMPNYYGADYLGDFPSIWRILFILKYVMENALLVKALEDDNIYSFIKNLMTNDEYSTQRELFRNCLSNKVIEAWSLNFDQCCFDEDCSCTDYYSEPECFWM